MRNGTYGTLQILDVGSIWMREFASAMCEQTPTVAWLPEMVRARIRGRARLERSEDPLLEMRRFPLQRGYARVPLRWVLRFEKRIAAMLRSGCEDPARSPLVCTTPFYAPVAELWPGPVVYYATDLTVGYDGLDPEQVRGLDRRMCRVAEAVCPNSQRIAEYFVGDAGCSPGKITVIPNATRAGNVPDWALLEPQALPEDIRDLQRPIAGVIGNLAGNMDWVVIRGAMERTPWLQWVFVGPTGRSLEDREQNGAREWVRGRARFVGATPYGELQRYARSFNVAVLPYRKKEPTYSGSSTRFYEHLPAGRPMVATRGFAELLEKVPLVRLVDTGEEMAASLEELRGKNFQDGLEMRRWEASRTGTWQERARMLRRSLGQESAPVTAEISEEVAQGVGRR